MRVCFLLLALAARPAPDHHSIPGNEARDGARHHHSHHHHDPSPLHHGHLPQHPINTRAHAHTRVKRVHAHASRQLHARAVRDAGTGANDGRHLGQRHIYVRRADNSQHLRALSHNNGEHPHARRADIGQHLHDAAHQRTHSHPHAPTTHREHDHHHNAHVAHQITRARDIHPRHAHHNPEARSSTKARHAHTRIIPTADDGHLRHAHHHKAHHAHAHTIPTAHDGHLRRTHHHKAHHAHTRTIPTTHDVHLHYAHLGTPVGTKCACIPNGLPAESGLKLDAPNTDSNVNYDYIEIKRTNNATGRVEYYPSTYGSYCDTWERYLDRNCTRMYPPAYCSQKWCFVSKGCNAPDVKFFVPIHIATLYVSRVW
eukprot:GEMP01027445.1.p1 GENE.GEMP01027445.1~~GEMP01027445.1.p1  ORF type:complete len:377 (+),score=50.89 GEMP01027445.1:22-1131(+)